ncbi:MAG: helix-turn-helix domain-containing protein [Alphaproteobacteria bacterium]|nr:helix-turn-helix domain-containing protein [Alphaproteobacteria bacterium]
MRYSTRSEEYQRLQTWLRKARQDTGLTQFELAEKLGRPQSFVAKIESGERRVDIFEFVQICEALGLNPNEALMAIINKEIDSRFRR